MNGTEIFWLAYVVGYLWFWRYHVGYAARMDGIYDLPFGLFFGSFGTLVWPISVPGRFGYIAYKKLEPTLGGEKNIFPGPKPIETRTEKAARLEREKTKEITRQRREINAKERELGMPLTRW